MQVTCLGSNGHPRSCACVQKLCCSHWEPLERQRQAAKLPVVIHLHGNCGCRADVVEFLQEVLDNGMTLVAIDLSGSGMSEGEYISLGWHEHHEAHTLIQHLQRHRRVSTVHLWGRSMGAVTALMYAIAHPGAVSHCQARVRAR